MHLYIIDNIYLLSKATIQFGTFISKKMFQI